MPRNRLATSTFALLTLALLSTTAQAQGVLTNGNSQFPACASSCQLLNQAAQACGGTTAATQGIWSCFCQSGYLKPLYNPAGDAGANGVCGATCTSPSDQAQVQDWYKTNCGSDNGVSEHQGGGAVASSPVGSATSAAASATASTQGGSSGQVDDTDDPTDGTSTYQGSWWNAHYRWIIMLLALFVALILLAVLAVWLKRRHDRRQDAIVGGFNAGITERPAPSSHSQSYTHDAKHGHAPPPQSRGQQAQQQPPTNFSYPTDPGTNASGRQSPVRTRDAFMPYGYGYARSESRLGSAGDVISTSGNRGSPLARGEMSTAEMEKEVGAGKGKGRRVLVRERDLGEKGLD